MMHADCADCWHSNCLNPRNVLRWLHATAGSLYPPPHRHLSSNERPFSRIQSVQNHHDHDYRQYYSTTVVLMLSCARVHVYACAVLMTRAHTVESKAQ